MDSLGSLLSRLPPGRGLQTYFAQAGLLNPERRVRQFETLDDALQWAEDRILGEHRPDATVGETALAPGDFELMGDALSRARFNEVSRAHPELAVEIFARLALTLALRLRHTNAQLRTLYDA